MRAGDTLDRVLNLAYRPWPAMRRRAAGLAPRCTAGPRLRGGQRRVPPAPRDGLSHPAARSPLAPLTAKIGMHAEQRPTWGGAHYRLPAMRYQDLPELEPVV